MAKLVFRLNHVPDTEAEAVRQLLTENHIEFYETHAGRWGFSVAALWLKKDTDFERARELIDMFQQQYQKQSREQFERDKKEGRIPTFWDLLRSNPVLYMSYVGLILIVLGLTLVPLFLLWR